MTIEQAIKKAIEGGWIYDIQIYFQYRDQQYENGFKQLNLSSIFLDPEFWRCFGKEMGWIQDATAPAFLEEQLPESLKGGTLELAAPDLTTPMWKYAWHRFIDALAEGKTAEEFFATL